MEIILVLAVAIVAFTGAMIQIGFLQSENRALRAMLDHHRDNTPIRVDDLLKIDGVPSADNPMPRHAQATQGQHRSH